MVATDFDNPSQMNIPHLNDQGFDITNDTIKSAQKKQRSIMTYGSPTKNFITKKDWLIRDMYGRSEPLLRSRIKDLCRDRVSVNSNGREHL